MPLISPLMPVPLLFYFFFVRLKLIVHAVDSCVRLYQCISPADRCLSVLCCVNLRYVSEPDVDQDTCPLQWCLARRVPHLLVDTLAAKFLSSPASCNYCTLRTLFLVAGRILNEKKRLEETQTLRARCSKAETKISHRRRPLSRGCGTDKI